MRYFSSLIFLIFISCSSLQQDKSVLSLDEVYFSSGVEEYFLSPIPMWINFSTEGSCFRKQPIRYLNFNKLKQSYNLSYIKMLHLQHMFNRKLFAYRTSTGQERLSLKDESFIFNNVYQQVLGGSYDFIAPRFKRISLIWIDAYLDRPSELKALFNKYEISQGHPVLMSYCLTSYEIEQFAQKNGLDDLGARYITAEMQSVYNFTGEKQAGFILELDKFFPDKDVKFFGVRKPKHLNENIKFVKIK